MRRSYRSYWVGMLLAGWALACSCGSETPQPSRAKSSPKAQQASPQELTAPRPADAGAAAQMIADAAPAQSKCSTETLIVGAEPLGYRASGQLCEELRSGPWSFVYLSGEPRRGGHYEQGLETGVWKHWYRSGGKRSEGSYLRGQRSGEWKRFHENGDRSLQGSYQGGLRDGRWRRWHDNGQLHEDRIYLAGRREGVHHKWSVEGLLQYTRLCKDDVCKVQCRAKGTRICPPLSEASSRASSPASSGKTSAP